MPRSSRKVKRKTPSIKRCRTKKGRFTPCKGKAKATRKRASKTRSTSKKGKRSTKPKRPNTFRGSKSASPCVRKKIQKVMHEWGQGKLYSSAGYKVTSQRQAIAIGYSEGNRYCDKGSKGKPSRK